jgi:hypothetical protein
MTDIMDSNGKILHKIIKKTDLVKGRVNVCSEDQFIQLATLNLEKGTTFKAHKHLWNYLNGSPQITQESWVVISGSVKVFYYNEEDEIIYFDILYPGEASITFFGGHNYEILEDDTIVYEFKTGRYFGQEFDKVFI